MNLLTGLLIVLAVLIYIYYRYKKHEKDPNRFPPNPNFERAKHDKDALDKDDYKFIKFLVDSFMDNEKGLTLKDSIYLKEIRFKCDEALKQY